MIQEKYKLPITGKINKATLDKLNAQNIELPFKMDDYEDILNVLQ